MTIKINNSLVNKVSLLSSTAVSPAVPKTFQLAYTFADANGYGTPNADQFAFSVAASSNYTICGANLEDDANGSSSGKAYIYSNSTGQLLYTLDNPNAYGTSQGDQFGSAVAISNGYAAVGAPLEEFSATQSDAGKVYVFSTTTGALVYTASHPSLNGGEGGNAFGSSVGISETHMIVGAKYSEVNTYSSAGRAYIYEINNWANRIPLIDPNPTGTMGSDYFGWSVAISPNYAIVGAPGEDTNGSASGNAYIYSKTGTLLHTLTDPNAYSTGANDSFGTSVAITDTYAIVGAYQEDIDAVSNTGIAYVYSTVTGQLLFTLNNPNPTESNVYFGSSVGISDTHAIVGAYGYTSNGVEANSGRAYIFSTTTGELVTTFDNPTSYSTGINDYFGYSVAIAGDYAVSGAYYEDTVGYASSGVAYVYRYS